MRATRIAPAIRAWDLWTLPRPLVAALLLMHAATTSVVVAAATSDLALTKANLAYVGVAVVGVVASRTHATWIPAKTADLYPGSQHIVHAADDCWFAAVALGAPLSLCVAFVLAFQAITFAVNVLNHRRAPQRWTKPVRPHRIAFSTSQVLLATVAGHEVFDMLADGTGLSARAVVAAGVAILCLQAVMTGAVFVVMRLAVHVPWRLLVNRERGAVLAQLSQQCLGVLIWAAWASARWSVLFVFPLLLSFEHAQRHSSLLEQAQTDAKTGLANLSYWQSRVEAMLTRNRVGSVPACVLLVDLDHFKRVNDTHGHLVGDEVLVGAAQRIAGAVRPADVVGRFGGEEFAVFLSPAGTDEAAAIAERVRAAVAQSPLATSGDGTEVWVTCSIGVAAVPDAPTGLSDSLSRADLALYGAKGSGRDRVEVAAPLEDERSSAAAHVRWIG